MVDCTAELRADALCSLVWPQGSHNIPKGWRSATGIAARRPRDAAGSGLRPERRHAATSAGDGARNRCGTTVNHGPAAKRPVGVTSIRWSIASGLCKWRLLRGLHWQLANKPWGVGRRGRCVRVGQQVHENGDDDELACIIMMGGGRGTQRSDQVPSMFVFLECGTVTASTTHQWA